MVKLKELGAKIIAFDIIFSEEAANCKEPNQKSVDEIFSDKITEFQNHQLGNRVILPYILQDKGAFGVYQQEIPNILLDMVLNFQTNGQGVLSLKVIEKYTWPIQELLRANSDLGYINMLEDNDGVFRHYPLVANIDELYFPSLAFQAFLAYSKKDYQVNISELSTGEVVTSKNDFFLNHKGEAKIRWLGDKDFFDSISLYQVLKSESKNLKLKAFFKDKIVFIGSTATGAHDLRHSPINAKMPGVYAHMNMTEMLLKGYTYQDTEKSLKMTLFILIFGLAILFITFIFRKATLDIFILFTLLLLTYFSR